MLTIKEQLILLIILKKGEITRNNQDIIKSRKFYSIMKDLEKKDLILGNFIKNNGNNIKSYKLTSFGKLRALCYAKDYDTDKELKNSKIIR